MKRTLLRSALPFFICLIFNTSSGQFRSLHDSLLAPNPDWTGDTAFMNFTPDGLRTDASLAGSLLWERPSFAGLGANWSLRIRMEFNPSSSNFCEFRFLQHHGDYYAIRLSGNSGDDLSFVRHSRYKDTILASAPGLLDQSKPDFTLRIERDTSATFSVYAADTALFSLTDSTLMQSSSLGIYARYTASRVNKFLFSTLAAAGYDFPDTLGPSLVKIDVLTPETLEVRWDEWSQLAALDGGFALLTENQSIVDTLHVINHYDEVWHLSAGRPLPRGSFQLELPAALDAENNLRLSSQGAVDIDYAAPKCVYITAVHPFSAYGGYFFTVQSDRDLGPVGIKILEADGDFKYYQTVLDSGVQVVSAGGTIGWHSAVASGLKLAKEGVIVLEKQGITLALQPYSFAFEASQEQGDFLLTTAAPDGTFSRWEAQALDQYVPAWQEPQEPPFQQPLHTFSTRGGELFAGFAHPPFAYLEMPGSVRRASLLASSYDPMMPYVLAARSKFPAALGDTLLPSGAVQDPEPGDVLINEIHFNPDSLEEFVELIHLRKGWVFLQELQLTKGRGTRLDDADLIAGDPASFTADLELWPVLGPEQIRAFPAPFSLPNDSTDLQLLARYGAVLDWAHYAPWETGEPHRSAERVSTAMEWGTTGNSGAHQSPWCCPSEASPNAVNSIANSSQTQLQAALSVELLSYDPRNFSPQSQLVLHADEEAKMNVSVYTLGGKLVAELYRETDLQAGEHWIPIQPSEWGATAVPTGIYLVHVQLKKNNGVQRKILPLSIYNP